MYDTRRWVKIITVVLSALFLVGIAACIYLEEKELSDRAAVIEEYNQKIYRYRNEVSELEDELKDIEQGSLYVSDSAKIVIGFVLSEATDLDYIVQKAAEYNFTPALLIDCTKELTDIAGSLVKADKSWDMILYAPSFTAELEQQIDQTQSRLAAADMTDANLLFVRGKPDQEKIQELVRKYGLDGYIYYSSAPTCGQNEDGSVYFSYYHLKDTHFSNDSIKTLQAELNNCVASRTAVLWAFDMSVLNAHAENKQHADTIFEMLQKSDAQYSLFSTASNAVAELKTYNRLSAELAAANEERRTAIHERIEELENKIKDLQNGIN